MYLKIQTLADVDRYMDQLRESARRVQAWVAAQSGDPLDLLRRMKIDNSTSLSRSIKLGPSPSRSPRRGSYSRYTRMLVGFGLRQELRRPFRSTS